jgi:hypothetical protein
MHLISSPFFSFDLQYDQQIEKETAGLLPLNQFPNERGSLVILYTSITINCIDQAKPYETK